VTNREELATNI